MTPELLKHLIDEVNKGKPDLPADVLSVQGYSSTNAFTAKE